MATVRAAGGFAVILWLVAINLVDAQTSILDISSFRSCILQDFSAKTGTEGEGQEGQYLNCSGFEQNVTVLDLRITPSRNGSSAEFVFNLTMVPSEDNKQRDTDDPNFCGAPEGQDCQLTDTATVRISRSRAILYYQMRQLYDITPNYCHLFYQEATSPTISTCFGCVNPSKVLGCWGWPFLESVNAGQTTEQLIRAALFQLKFYDLEQVAMGCPSTKPCGSQCGISAVNCTRQRQQFWRANTTSSESDQTPAVRQTLFGFDALRKTPTGGYNFNLPLPDPFPGPVIFSQFNTYGDYLQPFHCFGANCQGTANANAFEVGTFPNPATEPLTSNVKSDSGNVHITQLVPLCTVWAVDSVPKYAVTVDIEVKNQVTGQTEFMTIDNIVPNNRSSSLEKFISGRIESVNTADGYLGPFVSGLAIICGGNKIPHSATQQTEFINQVADAPNYNYTEMQFWDMRATADPGSPVQDNPWRILEQQITERAPEIDRFYPTNFQLNPTHPETSSVMWYYIAPDRVSTMDRGCGGCGFTDRYFSTSGNQDYPNRQTAQEACLHRPDLCMPGSFDGVWSNPNLDTCIPGCLAALAFTILSNSTTRAALAATPEGQARLDLAEKIARLSMPGSVGNIQTSHSYDSTNPQWFIADNNRLYYDPGDDVFVNDLNFEIILDIAAEFVGYRDQVSNGRLLVNDTSCVGTVQGQNNNFTIGVENTGTLDQQYLVLVQCPAAMDYTGPAEFTTELLSPGESQFKNLVWTTTAVPPATERSCLLTLFPGSVVIQAYLDNATVGCTISLPPAPQFKFNGSAIPPDVRPFDEGCKCWDFECFPSVTDSWCFLGLMIGLGVLLLAAIAAAITIIVAEIAYKKDRDHALGVRKAKLESFGPGSRRPGDAM
jgi:hypothetical protein